MKIINRRQTWKRHTVAIEVKKRDFMWVRWNDKNEVTHTNKEGHLKISILLQHRLKTPIGPLQLTVTWCKTRHVRTQETHWDKTNKELTSFKIVIFFVCFVPVRLLRPSMAVFVPCDCKLQRAYSLKPEFPPVERIAIITRKFQDTNCACFPWVCRGR